MNRDAARGKRRMPISATRHAGLRRACARTAQFLQPGIDVAYEDQRLAPFERDFGIDRFAHRQRGALFGRPASRAIAPS